MADLTLAAINEAFLPADLVKGRPYYQQGHAVLHTDSGTILSGTVQGRMRKPYQVVIRLIQPGDGSGLGIDGRCTCPVGVNCKHCVALLLAALNSPSRKTAVSSPSAAAPAQVAIRTASAPAASALAAVSPAIPETAEPPPVPLPDPVAQWLRKVVDPSDGEAYPPELRNRLLYLLHKVCLHNGREETAVHLKSVPLLKDGSYSTSPRNFHLNTIHHPTPPAYLRPSDYSIVRRIGQSEGYLSSGSIPLRGVGGAAILQMMIQTGRCHWETPTGAKVQAGEPLPGRISWKLQSDGQHLPFITPESSTVIGLPLEPPFYIDPEQGLCGPLETGLSVRQVGLFLSAPPLPPEVMLQVRQKLEQAVPPAHLPPVPQPPKQIHTKPVPRLWLYQGTLPDQMRRFDFAPAALARLSFFYDRHEIDPGAAADKPVIIEGGTITHIFRNQSAEGGAAAELTARNMYRVKEVLGWNAPKKCEKDWLLNRAPLDFQAWLSFITDVVPLLKHQGWLIDIDDSFPVQVLDAEGELDAVVSEGSGIDWFDLSLGVVVDGQRLDLLPALLTLLRQSSGDALERLLDDETASLTGRKIPLRLPDGRYLPLPVERLTPILRALSGLFASHDSISDGKIRLSLQDAAQLSEFADAAPALAWQGGESLRAMGQKLRDAAGLPPVAVPELFQGSLRPYQQAGLNWLQLLRDVGLGGVLADDMGLGKTVQTLAHLTIEKTAGRLDRPALIVAPTSVLPNWRAEAASFAPSLSVLVLHGSDRKAQFGAIPEVDLVLTTYPLLARDAAILTAQSWHIVIIDEAQVVKNPATNAAKVLRSLDSRHRLALSGTPMENHLGEMWALFDFVSPGFLGEKTIFNRSWRTPIEKKGDKERQAALSRRVKPFLLRRTKAEVAADLPPKTEILEHIELSPAQRDLYEAVRLTMHKKIRDAIATKGLARSRIEFLDALLKLRQICCDPRLLKSVKGAAKAGSSKLERLLELLTGLLDEGRSILLFSQFTSMLDLIQTELQKAEIPYVLLTGATTDRVTPVQNFQSGKVRLFLISLKAGGSGLNLTAADTVIHYDPWWNPAVESQATDRAHRIGQDKPVFVYKLVVQDSIEVKMADLKARKQALADGLFDPDAGGITDISEADIDYLLGEK